MAWTDNDLKIFAAGLAIGGKWNHTHGTLPRVKASVPSGTYSSVFDVTLSCDISAATIMYSADGGTPTTVYAGENITVDTEGTHVVYAYALYGQGLSPMAKYTYVIYVPRVVTSDSISVPPFSPSDSAIVAVADPVSISVADTLEIMPFTPTDIGGTVASFG